MFQFHEGPIKTATDAQSYCSYAPFQFHEGPIKTHKQTVTDCSQLSFNSMKVRLKPNALRETWFLTLFQFHEGPIKTCFYVLRTRTNLVSIP